MIYKQSFSLRILLTTLVLMFFNVGVTSATEHQIGQDANRNDSVNFVADDSVRFTGHSSGTFNHDSILDVVVTKIFSDTTNVGIVSLKSNSGYLTVNGDIGLSNANKIKNINFEGTGLSLNFNGSNMYVNTITVQNTNSGSINFSGSNQLISANIGGSGLLLNNIIVSEIGTKSFYGDIYTNIFSLQNGATATIFGSGTNSIGATTVNTGGILNINKNTTATSLNLLSSGVLNIASGAQLNLSANSTIDGALKINIADSRLTSNLPSISSTANIAFATNATTVNLDYSKATYLNIGDEYNFLTTTGALSYISSNVTVDGKTFLLYTPITSTSGMPNTLRVNLELDNANFNKLDSADKSVVNFLLNSTNYDSARTEMLKFSTQTQLESALSTLQIDKSNMIQMSSLNIQNAVSSNIDRHLQALSYNQFTFFKKNQIIKERNLRISDSDVKNPNSDYSKSSSFDKVDKKKFYIVDDGDKALWGDFFGGTTKQDNNISVKGFDTRSGGVIFGHDKIFKNQNSYSVLGGAFSYGKTNAESRAASGQTTTIDAYQFSVYRHGIASNGLGVFNEFVLDAGYNKYKLDRNIKIGTYQSNAKADFTGLQYGAKFGLGKNIAIGKQTIFAPIVAIKYFGLQLQDYREKNDNNLGLKVKNDHFGIVTSELGFRLNGDIDSRIRPQINVSWLHNFKSDGAKSSTTFINGVTNQEASKNKGVDLYADILNFGAGLNLKTSENTTMMLKYDLQKGSSFASHLGSVKFNWLFF